MVIQGGKCFLDWKGWRAVIYWWEYGWHFRVFFFFLTGREAAFGRDLFSVRDFSPR